MREIDLLHLGRERVICCFEDDGVLIDPGPQSCEETLLRALGELRPSAVLLTHIHFDHAGAAGALVRRWPELPVYVHERGARHLADPERLVASAARLYGEEGMRTLWGEVVPVPQDNLHVLSGGETVLGDYRVAYTPGHAKHHVSYLHEPSGRAFVGDTAGVRIMPAEAVLAPTPPPDVDVEAWERSLQVIEGWEASSLALTHFGLVPDAGPQLAAVRRRLHEQAELAERLDEPAFALELRRRLAAEADAGSVEAYVQAAPPEHLWQGLRRWLSSEA